MRIKVDENLPGEVAEELRSIGHVADTVADEGLSGAADPEIIAAAHSDRQIVFTLDKGIADILRYPPATHSGVVLFRPGSAGRRAVLGFVQRHLQALFEYSLEGRIAVVTDRGIRIR